jgi:glutamate/tyrosine decarboxylase-like PLP-dependent enzyme
MVAPGPTQETRPEDPMGAWFLGPRAENAKTWEELLGYVFRDYVHWRKSYFPTDPVIVGRSRRRSELHEAWLDELTGRLEATLNDLKCHFPLHSPRYNAHMLSELSLPAVLGYFAGMLYNPNNVTSEAAPITVALELEVGQMIGEMLGYNPKRCWAHICSGGSIANLEALWVARSATFVPFIVREFCKDRGWEFLVKSAHGEPLSIHSLSPQELLGLRPNEAIFMLRKLAHAMQQEHGMQGARVIAELNEHYRQSAYNPAARGLWAVLRRLDVQPCIFVSAAAHYSLKKAANTLGYGEDAIRPIPVTERFQIDLAELERALWDLDDNEYVAAVVGIVGTTEEGAVDPIHKIRFLRDRLEQERNRSFWLHVDAAWGGYFRSMFCGHERSGVQTHRDLRSICDEYVHTLGMEERFALEYGGKHKRVKAVTIRWTDRDIYASFLAMADADSTTIDPHKMGYVPYPAGVAAFRNGLVTELIVQRAQYISDDSGGMKGIDEPAKIVDVGQYILEGSKPGAAPLACWLAHKTIPLDITGHGAIARETLLNAKRLFKYLVYHRHMFYTFHSALFGEVQTDLPFTFFPLTEPDTNVLCFIARPMAWVSGHLESVDTALSDINAVNEGIYRRTSIDASAHKSVRSLVQPFFVSRTRLEASQYDGKATRRLLERLGIRHADYAAHGPFVLRSVVMNPWHSAARESGIDYLYDLVQHLHEAAAATMEEVANARRQRSGARRHE